MGRGVRTPIAQRAATAATDIRDLLRRPAAGTPDWHTATAAAPRGLGALDDDQRRVRLDGFHADTIAATLAGPGRTVVIADDRAYVRVDLDNGWAVGMGWRQGGPGTVRNGASGHCDGGALTAEAAIWDSQDRMVDIYVDDFDAPQPVHNDQTVEEVLVLIADAEAGTLRLRRAD